MHYERDFNGASLRVPVVRRNLYLPALERAITLGPFYLLAGSGSLRLWRRGRRWRDGRLGRRRWSNGRRGRGGVGATVGVGEGIGGKACIAGGMVNSGAGAAGVGAGPSQAMLTITARARTARKLTANNCFIVLPLTGKFLPSSALRAGLKEACTNCIRAVDIQPSGQLHPALAPMPAGRGRIGFRLLHPAAPSRLSPR